MRMTREQRVEKLRRELSNLKAELRKTKGDYKRSILQSEIRAVAHQLVAMRDSN